MQEIFENVKSILKRDLAILWIFSVLLGLALIALDLRHKLPLGAGDFVFISILALCFALYRPRWAFLVFVSLIPLENIILVSGYLPMQLRPYQYIGMILVAAVLILWIVKRLNFKLIKPDWLDWLFFSLVPLSFLSTINSPNKSISLKNNLILFSFIVLYYLVRNFVRSRQDFVKTAFFLLGSNLVVLTFGFYQAFADKFLAYRQAGGGHSFEVMFGRPNSTFTEPDWLGIYLDFSLALLLVATYFLEKISEKLSVYFLIFINLTLLVLTLSRSAWVGAAAIILVYIVFNLFEKKSGKFVFTPREFANKLGAILLVSLISLAAIYFGKLSKFDIFDRARSTATSEQKITIACSSSTNYPPTVSSTDELAKYDCKFINLEEIASYKSQGKFITEIFRKDPNVMTRSQIYKKSYAIIREHPVLGVGFGTITQALGTDERGAGLNESNIFLQVWAGMGILGLTAYVIAILYLLIFGLYGALMTKGDFERKTNIFVFIGISALIVPNLFNAGLFMGILWLVLGFIVSISYIRI